MKTQKLTSKVFRFGGLAIASEIDLPGLPEVATPSFDVSIRIGTPPHALLDATEIDPECFANDSEYLYSVPELAVFYLNGGHEIIVKPLDNNRMGELRSYLFSIIVSVLFFRRGLLPLHASAVNVGGRVFAFLGKSGAGKSTLAAYLGERGYPVIADDLTLLNRTEDGTTRVTPCAPWVKLWRDALDGFGMQIREESQLAGKHSKYLIPLAEAADDPGPPLPLGGLFLLEESSENEATVVPITSAAAIAAMMAFTYPALLVHKLGRDAELFRRCGEVLGTVPVAAFRRARNLAKFDEQVDTLLAAIPAMSFESKS